MGNRLLRGKKPITSKEEDGFRDLIAYRDSLKLPIDDETLENAPLYHPGEDSDEIEYLRSRREALGGYLPSRRSPRSTSRFQRNLPSRSLMKVLGKAC